MKIEKTKTVVLIITCVLAVSSCALVEKEREKKLDDIEFSRVNEETNSHLDLWKTEKNFPVCSSNNLSLADEISNKYEDEAISSKFVLRKGIKVLPPWIGSRIGKLRMSIADSAYNNGCLDIAKKIYTDIHESYNNYLVDDYVSPNKKAKSRLVAIGQKK